ncbi:hypothetical protein CPB83DRAFT_840285 [Crepidotus variabilis]|uniref:Uncharacterized protein n=1 Tax=Crepidotus variabilis TaxID=179855 RepID=A0A9P6E5A6_9AGAR|nr:hypothetical protein CPB83DRAFT_840285 [Crepidotus variabilis]
MRPLSSSQITAQRDAWRKQQEEIEREAEKQKMMQINERLKREAEYRQMIEEAKKREDEEWQARTSWTNQDGAQAQASSSTTVIPTPNKTKEFKESRVVDPLDKKARKGIPSRTGKKFVYLVEDDIIENCFPEDV